MVGAAGGVSYAAVQLARMAGATVIATTSGPAKAAELRALGVTVIDYRAEDVVTTVLTLTGGEGAEPVVDNVGAATWGQSLRCLARGGHLVTCGFTTGGHPSAELQRLFVRQLSVHGSTMGNLEEFRRMIQAFETGGFVPRIDSVFPLERITDAFPRLEHPDRLGKVVIDIAPPAGPRRNLMDYESILAATNGPVGIITLNRPEALNALSATLTREVSEVAAAFDADDSIGAIVITGSANAFAAGADIKEIKDKTFAEVYPEDFITATWEGVSRCRKPTLAAVSGHVVGGGCELAMIATS